MVPKLKEWDDAPDFTATTWPKGELSLSSFKGKKVWLAFFRYASCPLCNLRVNDIIKNYGSFAEKGIEIICVFQSPLESISKYVGTQNPPFKLVSDPSEKLYELYGLSSGIGAFINPRNIVPAMMAMAKGFLPGRMEGKITRVPGDFLIDGEMKIHTTFYGSAIGDHIPFESVHRFADS